jgi:hypothetical protein|tara:strand:- start:408 stop:572 length:165 start_codon:yes stop_codon:yes gene_type:complete
MQPKSPLNQNHPIAPVAPCENPASTGKNKRFWHVMDKNRNIMGFYGSQCQTAGK